MKKQSECIHCEVISSPAPGEDEIGVCRYCGKTTNYTELQQKYPILYNESLFTRNDMSMKTIMASLNGGKRYKRSNHRKRANKGVLNGQRAI